MIKNSSANLLAKVNEQICLESFVFYTSKTCVIAESYLVFSRGGGGFSKNFVDLFRPTKLIFRAVPKHLKDRFGQIFCAGGTSFKNTGQKRRV